MSNFSRLFLASILTALLLAAETRAADEPPHTVVLRDGPIEIRDYAPMILAEVEVSGPMARAGNAGFRPLADYIFGGNTSRQATGSDEITMTTPVIQSRSQSIAMTTPVTQTRGQVGHWRVAFVMPPEWTMETLPVPNDQRITLNEAPARRMAAIRFSGGPNRSRFEEMSDELIAFLQNEGYDIVGEPVYARYDPPWVPTPFRRNEVMIEIAR
ncbi:heme-binding protein [Hyphobacterium sp. HN65]|uniref:Heme-binding protein n=1 Tax=Hyphobacterium lacteum TaxID=3116575 RepID=A0ABU7LSG9_9PROT|nr:heme-binding protein [Hyphobacterium sp. HN65]MEE2526862.1 heme-binding protein [Hyphobacterium sp. HN65]